MSHKGHDITFIEIDREDVDGTRDTLSSVIDADVSIIRIRNVFAETDVARAADRLQASDIQPNWTSPNHGMKGGEIRTIGAAATPSFTSFSGPTRSEYQESVPGHEAVTKKVFDPCSPTTVLTDLFSDLFAGKPAETPVFNSGIPWLPFNYRALDEGHQIYPHHDNHYRLPIYDAFPSQLDQSVILSWFVLLQGAERGGELVVYGLWGSDPDPPILPTRFLDTDVLESDYKRCVVPMNVGDVVLFNSGRHVHRVSTVQPARSRLTMGGFATVNQDRTKAAFWS